MKDYHFEMQDLSTAELDRFERWMTQVLIETTERKKAQKNFEEHVAVHYEGRNLKKEAVKKRIQQRSKHVKGKVAPKGLPKPKQNIKAINNRGFIIAPNGIRLHGTPSPSDKAYTEKKGVAAQICKPSNKGIQVLYEDMDNKGWYKIRTPDKKEGFVEKHYIAIVPYNKYLDAYTYTYHFVLPNENFETHIAKRYLNNIALKTGFDRRNLAEAFSMLNAQSKHDHGVHFDGKTLSPADLLSMAAKLHVDPSFHKARVNYKTMQLKQYHIVRVPNYRYILLQKQLSTLSSRPEFMNKAVDVGHALAEVLAGMAGLIAGIIEGLFMGIYDMLVGIIDSIKQIIETIYDLFTGVLFEKLKNMFLSIIETIKKMTPEEVKKAFMSMLGKAGEHILATINNWAKSSSFEKGRVIGLVLGNLLLEVLLAIFTGGSANMAKWASKLGKLGKVLLKVAEFADDIKDKLKKKLPKKYFEKGVYKNDPDDTKNWQRAALFVQGKAITETLDARGTTVTELMTALNSIKIFPKLSRKWDNQSNFSKGKNVYAITLTASPTKTVDANFTSGEKDGKNNREQTDLTKEEIDKLQKIDGQYPINSLEFAGRTFDFNLDKNPRMKKIMEKRWKEQGLSIAEKTKEFENLFKKYPKGVKFTEQGFPDFNPYVLKFEGKKIQVKLDRLNVGKAGSHKDIREAVKKFKLENPDCTLPENGYTWHHIENTTELQLVPFDLHKIVKHHGGRSTIK